MASVRPFALLPRADPLHHFGQCLRPETHREEVQKATLFAPLGRDCRMPTSDARPLPPGVFGDSSIPVGTFIVGANRPNPSRGLWGSFTLRSCVPLGDLLLYLALREPVSGRP